MRTGYSSYSARSRFWAHSPEADLFACELLAPTMALRARLPRLRADDATIAQAQFVLTSEIGLPPRPAAVWARRFVARHGEPITLLDRLRLS